VLVVGASAAGLATVTALRGGGYSGRITVVGAERHLPYDRPPLSKQVLSGAWSPERTTLPQSPDLDVEFVLGDRAIALDVPARTVRTVADRALTADAVVIATGLRARTLGDLAGVHVLRTLDDALALRADLLTATRVVVVGDGVLGAEIAATASALAPDVTMAGPQPAPLADQFGPQVAGLLADVHAERGVRLRLGAGVSELVGDGRVTGVRLATGEVLPADVVVVAIGAAPVTDWLTTSGLTLDDGVVCDAGCRAADGIFAVGDVARWRHAASGELVRLENRTNAVEQAGVVAANILGADQPYVPVPYLWTDQFDVRIQVHGAVSASAEVTIVDGSVEDRRFVARYGRDGAVVGVLGWNMPKQVRRRRCEVMAEPAALPDRLS
jgi:NADPH-dependent 2,4-dienoyl-CoA reductase/sulfur reductase-like enzyme